MSRQEFPRETRKAALRRSKGLCEASGPRYGLAEGFRCDAPLSKGVQFDHDLPDQMEGANDLDNCRAICVPCHKRKTANDIRQIRKADRQRDKHSGAFKPSANPVPGSRRSPFKRRMDGTTVLRSSPSHR